MWSKGVGAVCILVTRVVYFTLVNVYELTDRKEGITIMQQLSFIRKNLIYVHFKRWLRLIPFSQCSPSNPGGHKHRYPLNVNPDWQVALFWHRELLSQAFWRRKTQWNEITKERSRVWVKEETKYRMIECTRICINIHIVLALFQGDSFEKSICNSPSNHDNKTWHELSSHCHISDAWRY